MALTDPPAMIFVTGIPAAGKSTVADRLARRFPRGVHVKATSSGGWSSPAGM
jgi:adenylylsulfate kinase-like enzyme